MKNLFIQPFLVITDNRMQLVTAALTNPNKQTTDIICRHEK